MSKFTVKNGVLVESKKAPQGAPDYQGKRKAQGQAEAARRKAAEAK